MTGSLQTKKGKYYAVYRDDNGKQRWVPLDLPVEGNNKRKALKKLQEVLADAEKSKAIVTSNIQFVDWLLRWLDQKSSSISAGTLEGYKLYLDKHIIPYFEPKKLTLSKLNAQHLQGYYNKKIKEGQSGCTLLKHNAIINGALKEAVLKDIIPSNPIDKVTLPKKKKFHGTAYTLEETRTLLNCSGDDPLRPAIVLGLFYGLRRSEVLGLRWRDINFESESVYIHRTVTRVVTLHENDDTKSECSRRRLRIVPGTELYFKDLMKRQKEQLADFGQTFSLDNPVCVWPDGRSLGPDYISHHFKLLLEKNKLPHIRFHDLRHTAGSLLLEDGVDIKTIQEFLGHSEASTTANIYLHSIVRGGHVTANSLSRIIV